MPRSKQYAGMRMGTHVINSAGVWVKSKFAKMRLHKNSRVSDYEYLNVDRVKKTHTSPVVRTKENDGHDNPTRMRHARTKAFHAANRT